MLVLSRRLNEAVFINGDIMVMVTNIDPDGRVWLGIDAPPEVSIARAELVAESLDLSEDMSHSAIFAEAKACGYVWVKKP